MRLKSLAILTTLAILSFATLFDTAQAVTLKTHTFITKGQGDLPTVLFYVVSNNTTNATQYVVIVGSGVGGPNPSLPGLMSTIFSTSGGDMPWTLACFFGPSPSSASDTVFEDFDIMFQLGAGLFDAKDIYDYWPYPVIAGSPQIICYMPVGIAGGTNGLDTTISSINNAGVMVGTVGGYEGPPSTSIGPWGAQFQAVTDFNCDLDEMSAEISPTEISGEVAVPTENTFGLLVNENGDVVALLTGGGYVLLTSANVLTTISADGSFVPAWMTRTDTIVGTRNSHAGAYFTIPSGFESLAGLVDLQAAGVFPTGTKSSSAVFVNDSGLICGSYVDSSSVSHGYTWNSNSGVFTTIGLASANWINSAGIVAGATSNGDTGLWVNSSVEDIGNDGAATCINNLGEVVTATGNMWNQQSGWEPILSLLPTGLGLTLSPNLIINDLGQISGASWTGEITNGGDLFSGTMGMSIQPYNVVDPSFELPTELTSTSAWTVPSTSPHASLSTGMTPPTPSGVQYAVLSTDATGGAGHNGEVTQTITVNQTAGYTVRFAAIQAVSNPTPQKVWVDIDGTFAQSFTPQAGTWQCANPRSAFSTYYETDPIPLTAGTHTLDIYSDTSIVNSSVDVDAVSLSEPYPAITSISPTTSNINVGGIGLTVNGYNFLPTSVIYWVAPGQTPTALQTFYDSSGEIAAIIPGSNLDVGNGHIEVLNTPGQFSNKALLPVVGAPTLTSLSPPSINNASPSTTLTINGSDFETDGLTVDFQTTSGTTALAVTSVTTTQIKATIPAALLLSAGSANVTVINNVGAGPSNSLAFTIINHTLTSFSAGLQMIGAPETYTGMTLGQIFDQPITMAAWITASSIYTVSPAPSANTMVAGTGYWVRIPAGGANLLNTGTPTNSAQSFSVTLQSGWSLISDPFTFSVSLSSIEVNSTAPTAPFGTNTNVVWSTLYTYGPGSAAYTLVTAGSIQPYVGYWVYAFVPCTLVMPGAG